MTFEEFHQIKLDFLDRLNYSIESIEQDPICRAIMNDDVKSLISLIKDKEIPKFVNFFFPTEDKITYLEISSYYGAIKCFKYIISKYYQEPSENTLYFSFLGGNTDIIKKCLMKLSRCYSMDYKRMSVKSMEFAILSHNIDLVDYLIKEHNIPIDLNGCIQFHNIQAYLLNLYYSNDIKKTFVICPAFNFPSLCEYFISHGIDVNSIDERRKTALHIAAETNSIEIAEILISHGADINAKDCNKKQHYTL